jgi:archaellum component FlaC
MTYSEKIKELHLQSKSLMAEYRIIAREINTYLRSGIPVEQEMIRLQHLKQEEFSRLIYRHNQLVAKVTSKKVLFTDPYEETI